MSRGVFCSAATIEFRFGWLVEPDIEAIARSTMSTPASLAFRIGRRTARPLVSCVWKWIGRPISSFSAFTSCYAAYGRHRPAMSLIARMCAPICSSSFASFT